MGLNLQIAQLAELQTVDATGGLPAFDVNQYHSWARIVLMHGAADEGEVSVKLQDSANGSAGWEDVATFADIADEAGIQTIDVQTDGLRGSLRLHVTVDGNACDLAAVIVGRRQYVKDYAAEAEAE
jgi:hypothetical protein